MLVFYEWFIVVYLVGFVLTSIVTGVIDQQHGFTTRHILSGYFWPLTLVWIILVVIYASLHSVGVFISEKTKRR